jgi:hypothetical protein
MFQPDVRSLNSSNTVIDTLKTARKILLHSSSRGAKVHCMRIMNAFLSYFLSSSSPSTPSRDGGTFEKYEICIRDIIVTKFFTKPILATMVDAYKVMEAYKHEEIGTERDDKQVGIE